MRATAAAPPALTVNMFFLWRFLGFRRLIVLFVLRQAWRLIRGRPPSRRRTRPSPGVDATV